MPEVAIKLSRENLVEGLATLPLKEIKGIIDSLIQKNLFSPPSAREICRRASRITKKKGLRVDMAQEAVKWARAKK
jgi:hypothetical protein